MDDHAKKRSENPLYSNWTFIDCYMDQSLPEVLPWKNNSRFDGPLAKMSYIHSLLNHTIAVNKIPNHKETFSRLNEYEIIVGNKQLKSYAEFVEDRVKGLRVLVD